MTKQLEHMLLSNDAQMHGLIKTMYQQWYQRSIISVAIEIIIFASLLIFGLVYLRHLHKVYQTHKQDWTDGFILWTIDQNIFISICAYIALVTAAVLLICIIADIVNLTVNPYFTFVHQLLQIHN